MANVVTPSQLSKRSDFYYQLANLVGAGIPIISGLEQVLSSPPSHSYSAPLRAMIIDLNRGSTFGDALEARGKWIPHFDLALLNAGERSGRLDQALRLLSTFYKDRAQMVSKVISSMMYPLLLLHMAVLIFPTGMLSKLILEGKVVEFLIQKLAILGPLYVLTFVVIVASSGTRGEAWRSFMEKILHPVPLLGEARRSMSMARLSAALEALISAGVTIVEAWPLAARASGSPAVGREVSRMLPKVHQGQTPGEVLRGSRYFPDLFKSMYSSGEISGKLDDDLRRLHMLYTEEAFRRYAALAEWFPKLMYLIIALAVAFSIIRFYMNYFGQISDIIGK